jgi:hypothetical protein
MLNADVISFREFVMHEPLPLATIQGAVLEFLQGRDDAVLFGAQAVNAYVDEPRATQDVDIMSTRAHEFAEELRKYLGERFHIAVRVREIRDKGLRVYQVKKEGNRHLVDVRIETEFRPSQIVEQVQVLTPPELIASKVTSYCSRSGQPKAFTDRRDLAVLLLHFPELKVRDGDVSAALTRQGAGVEAIAFWSELVDQKIVEPAADDDLDF